MAEPHAHSQPIQTYGHAIARRRRRRHAWPILLFALLAVVYPLLLTFSHHIDQVCRSCYYQLRQLRVIARSLTFNAAVSPVHAFVFSRLDYCSSIFAGLPGVRMEKLRRVYRAAARLIGGFRKFDHIFHYMRDVLHWLPLPQSISYRIASLVWRCLSSWAPSTLPHLFP